MGKGLIDEVFSWSLSDILDEELYKEKVEKIPDSFQAVDQYFASFVYPLLEETRAQLASSLEKVSRAPYAQVTYFDSTKQNGKLYYDIEVDYWRNRCGVDGERSYRTFAGDYFVFTDAKPEAVSDLPQLERGWALLSKITENKNGDGHTLTFLRVLSSKEIQVKLSSGRPLFIVFLMNMRTNERIWNSLQMGGNMNVIKQILCSPTQDEKNYALCRARGNCLVFEEYIRTLPSELNKSQRKVVVDILYRIECNHRSFVELILGPPGTGKTRTLSIFLYTLLRMNRRSLVCAPTDVAIAELASRVLKLVKESSEASYLLGRILYFGDQGLSGVNAHIGEIYMDHQVETLDSSSRLLTASLIFCTASSSYALHSVLANKLNLLIVDEAAQLKECELSIPLQLPGVRHSVLFGDHCQLSATVTSNASARAGFGRSLFERLISIGHSKHILDMQYRMHPLISLLPNSEFYGNQILDAPNVKNKRYKKCIRLLPLFGPYSFINVSCGREEMDSFTCSFKNMVEVAMVTKIIRKLFKAWGKSKEMLSVGIVATYTAQVIAIKEKVGQKYDSFDRFSLKVSTIDGFQGGEEDVIIFSTVRSNAKGSVGDISNRQRTNVALTRARCCLWIVGDGRTLFDSNTVWKSIVQDAKDRNCFYNAEEDEDLADVVLEVKKEMDQLDDFLNADSLLFKNARWKVLFSDNFRKSFEKLKSSETKKLILNLLLRLSCGWRPKRRSTNLVCDDFSQMLKQFKVKDLHIICSIDVVKDSCYIQVLKVWDILPLEDIPLLVDHLSTIFQSYTDEFIKRCKVKCLEGDLEVPKSWNSCISRYKRDCVQSGNNSSAFVESCKSSDSFLLMKFYALSAGVVSHLLSGCDGNEIDFLFELTEEEKDIIEFSGSSFILGRSGTGKTTVLIMKLVQKEQLYHLAAEGFHKVESNSSASSTLRKDNAGSEVEIKGNILRQIFVTVNVKLCYAVRQYISRLKRSMCGCNSSAEGFQSNLDDIDEASQFSDIPDSFSDIPRSSYPLVITFNKFLMMLDGTVGRSFFGRLLEFTGLSQEKRKGSRSMALKTFIRTKEVHYDKFCSAYWPHFSIQLTKKLDPSTIFAEIVSHIKGGSCVGVQDDKLSREDYISYSRRRLSHLSEQERGTIYDIFIQYEKKKKTRGEFDLSDFVIDLHHRLGDENYEGEKMDFVYVDEVQDLTMRQISLFKYICRNFEDGFVFSGDTAQTIVRGVDFRFKDIKALFYREFTACERNGKGQVSDIFNLSQNFRSHAGVLKLANSVLNLLYHFFPSSVDRLQPETSLVNGEEPVWVQMRNGENTLCSFFKGSGSFDRGIFGFGAEQVILVRDDSHRNEVLNYVGKQALVLTLTECKGLEFQDVLLYNFFSSSPLKDQWEVIYGYMKEQNLIDSPLLKSFPIFNEGKHISLCLELKQLYVAITRTRKRLWIFESRFCSMFNYWEKLHLVQIRELEYNFLQEIQVASSQREWKARGMKFFYQQNYDKARFCFEKAGESYLEKWAVAAGSVSTADQMRDSNPKMADIHLTEAAHIYESIGKNESAALCFFELREYEKAGIIYLEKCGESKLEEAGECFYSAGCYKRAAEIYARCNLFSKCLSACADGKLFEVGYDFIQLWKENKFLIGQGFLESEELQKFLERGALYFQKLQDSESMMKFVKDFQSENLMRTFLKSVDCLDELVLLEKERGNFLEAANVANMKGDILLGVDLLQMGRRFKEASGVILSYVLYNSLWVHGSKGWPLKQFEKKEELLIKAKTYAENVSQHYHNFVCIEADILSHGKSSLFTMEKNWGDSARHGSFRGKILGARKILDAYLYQGTPQHENEVYLVEDLIKYTQNKKSREKTSVGGIVYYWNFWKEEIENILSSIQDTKEDSYSEFCLNYFGVSKQLKNEKTLYLLLYPDAEWVKGANLRNIKRGNSIWIDADQFVWSAIRYWSSEMLTVGVKVLEILEAFYVFSVDNALSLNCKTMLLIEIFRVSKSLIESKFLNHRDSSNILQRFLEIPIKNFFGHIYPLDWRMPMTKDMIYLRDTELSRNLLREVVYRIIRSRAIANGQLGMLMTIILSGKFSTNLYMQIATTLGDNISWKEFIENFIQTKSNDNSIEDPSDFDLVVKFHRALADTEYTDFSPSVFLYLVDRLLILVSYLKGYFFTTKSSLVEWLMSRGWNTETNLDYLSDVQVQPLLEETVGFVAHTVNKLICSEPLKWIKRYNLKMEFYPLLVLRLFVVLCLLCINFDGYYDLLFNLLDKREVTSLLPWKFYKSLWRLREHEKAHINIKVVSEALKGIGNPLVVVNLGLHCAEFSFPGAIFLHLNVEQGRKCILQRLFLKNDMFSSNRARCSKLARKDSFGGGISLKINHQEIPSASSFVTTSDPVKAQQTNRNFWAMLGTVEFNPLTDASWLMEMILEYVLLVNATMRCCRRGNCCHSSGSAAGMVNKVRDELQQLYSALDSSEWEVQDNRIIRDLLKKLQLRRKRMEPLLDQLLICDSNKRKEHAALKTSVKDGDSGTAEKSSTGAEASNSTSC
ncbi:hypothetical protein P3X46_028228 [Hevea brasiliensis]|uniref:UvrD-like helicase ATP-binding domain-containing protein n=1 Tax=Hevea brasiliensis TaxID=3981 RepID=A0ABQ9KNE0_HEVBR|nr:uncharacterized protein LOC110652351 isoform X2 [Hevea brasiliensis]KAJ9145900.1 hypothetical protein P3X46_028228 [Hevea brasiliensis]